MEGDDEITVRRNDGILLLSAQLTHDTPPNSQLQTWLRLGAASLSHFHGALAQAPANGTLWLVHCMPAPHSEPSVLKSLEALLNQRDTWRALFNRLRRPIQKHRLNSLRPLPY